MQKFAILLTWVAAADKSEWEHTAALVYVTCKPRNLSKVAQDTREYYGADVVAY